jgi:alcohol dehydrogenase (cytochrome c)
MQNGQMQHLMMQADRNGMFYVLDRTNGKVLFAKPYVKVTWNRGIGKDGRPILTSGWQSSPEGNTVYPSGGGGANWQSPSYDPVRSTLYVQARDGGVVYRSGPANYEAGRQYWGGSSLRLNSPSENDVLAIDTNTGNVKWKFPLNSMSAGAGVLATSSGLVFVATAEGNLIALDERSGQSLWHFQTGTTIESSPMSYSVDGKQFVAVSAGNVLYSFALPD